MPDTTARPLPTLAERRTAAQQIVADLICDRDALTAENRRLRAELGRAQELIAELRNNRERDDRAYAAYDTAAADTTSKEH